MEIRDVEYKKYSGSKLITISSRIAKKSYTDYIAAELSKLGDQTMANLKYVTERITAERDMTREERDSVSKQLESAREKIKSIWPQSQLMQDDIAKLQPYFAQEKHFEKDSHIKFLMPLCEQVLVYLSELVGDNLQNIKNNLLHPPNSSIIFYLRSHVPGQMEPISDEMHRVIADLTPDYFKAEEFKFIEEKATGAVTSSGLPLSIYETENRCWAPSKAALEREILKVKQEFEEAMNSMKREVRTQLKGQKQTNALESLKHLEDDVTRKFFVLPKYLIAPDIFPFIKPEDRIKQVQYISDDIQRSYGQYFEQVLGMTSGAYKRLYGLIFRFSVINLRDLDK